MILSFVYWHSKVQMFCCIREALVQNIKHISSAQFSEACCMRQFFAWPCPEVHMSATDFPGERRLYFFLEKELASYKMPYFMYFVIELWKSRKILCYDIKCFVSIIKLFFHIFGFYLCREKNWKSSVKEEQTEHLMSIILREILRQIK